jgi:hypothetical protein
MNPAFAPRTVVAMSSPEPTTAADRIRPGPRNLRAEAVPGGGADITEELSGRLIPMPPILIQ